MQCSAAAFARSSWTRLALADLRRRRCQQLDGDNIGSWMMASLPLIDEFSQLSWKTSVFVGVCR